MDGARTHPPSLRRERATRDRRPRRRRADLRRAPHARSRRPAAHARAHGGPRAAGSRPRAARPPAAAARDARRPPRSGIRAPRRGAGPRDRARHRRAVLARHRRRHARERRRLRRLLRGRDREGGDGLPARAARRRADAPFDRDADPLRRRRRTAQLRSLLARRPCGQRAHPPRDPRARQARGGALGDRFEQHDGDPPRGPLRVFVVAGIERRGLSPEALALRTLYLARSDPLGLTSDEHLRLRVHLEVAPPGRVAILARIGRDDRVAGALGHVLQRDALGTPALATARGEEEDGHPVDPRAETTAAQAECRAVKAPDRHHERRPSDRGHLGLRGARRDEELEAAELLEAELRADGRRRSPGGLDHRGGPAIGPRVRQSPRDERRVEPATAVVRKRPRSTGPEKPLDARRASSSRGRVSGPTTQPNAFVPYAARTWSTVVSTAPGARSARPTRFAIGWEIGVTRPRTPAMRSGSTFPGSGPYTWNEVSIARTSSSFVGT